MISGVCYKRKKRKKKKTPKIYSETPVGFYIYFGISDMLVHPHGTLLKSAEWVGFYLLGFMESLKHLFRSDSPAQDKDVSQGKCRSLGCVHALTLAAADGGNADERVGGDGLWRKGQGFLLWKLGSATGLGAADTGSLK